MSIFSPTKKKSKEKKTESATTKTELPAYINTASQQAVDLASQAATKPYVAYSGDRTAGLTPEQQAASNATAQFMQGGATPPSILDDVMGHSTADYMNPYKDQVLAIMMDELAKSRAVAQNDLGLREHGMSAFGDARHGVEASNLNADYMKESTDATSKFLFDALNQAYGLKGGDLTRGMQAEKDKVAAANQLFQQGTVGQATGQHEADAQYEAYLRQQGYPEEMIKLLSSTVAGVPTDKTTNATGQSTTKTTTPGPSIFQSITEPIAVAAGTALGSYAGTKKPGGP